MTKVAIHLLTYFSSSDFLKLLESLRAQTFRDWELFVYENSVDEKQTQAVKRALDASEIPYHFTIGEKNIGFVANNELMKQHRAEFILLLNDDCFLDKEYLEQCVVRMDVDSKCAAVTGLIYRDESHSQVDTAGLTYICLGFVIDDHQAHKEAGPVFGTSGTASLLRRSAIDDIGGYIVDPSFFMYKEDVERALRFNKKGYTAWLEPKAIAFHERGIKETGKGWVSRIRDERGRSVANRVQTYKNQWTMYRRYFSWKLGIVDIVCTVWHELKRSASLFVFGGPRVFFKTWSQIPLLTKDVKSRGDHVPLREGLGEVGAHREIPTPSNSPSERGRIDQFPKVAILYLSFATANWREDIPRAMNSLQSIRYPIEQIELICIESKSPSGERVKDWFEKEWMPKSGKEMPHMTYIYNDAKIGFAGNENIGVAKAKELGCKYIYLLNEDAEVHEDVLRYAVERAEQDEKIAWVQSLIMLGQDKTKVNSVGNAFHYLGFGYSNGYLWTKDQVDPVSREIGYASWAGALGRISAIDACGGFDEGFFLYHEDTDGSFQAVIRGYKVVIESSSIVYHYYEFAKSIKNYYWMERNRYALIFSYYRIWTLILIAPMLLAMELGQFFFSIFRGWSKEKIRVYRELLSRSFWQWVMTRRHKIQSVRVISDRVFSRRFVSSVEFQGEGVKNPVLTYMGNPIMRAYWRLAKFLIF